MQSVRSTHTMKTEALSVILTFVSLILTHGVDSNSLIKEPTTKSKLRILYGKPAALSDFPFLVKLDIAGALGAGAIINDHWILTAGHCVYNYVCPVVMTIFPAVWSHGQSVKPVQCYAHPQYTNFTNTYDIGLIKIQENLVQDGRARAIALPQPGTVYLPGTRAVIAGWGQTETDEMPDNLLRADFVIEPWDYCNNMYLAAACANVINCDTQGLPRRTLCTLGVGVPASGSCFGDSGGPVVIHNEVAGVVSFGISKGVREDTCEIGAPSLNTKIVDFLPWIYSHIAPEMDTSRYPVEPEY